MTLPTSIAGQRIFLHLREVNHSPCQSTQLLLYVRPSSLHPSDDLLAPVVTLLIPYDCLLFFPSYAVAPVSKVYVLC